MGMKEDRGWENEGLGVSSDEQVSTTTADPSCNIGSQGNLAQGWRPRSMVGVLGVGERETTMGERDERERVEKSRARGTRN